MEPIYIILFIILGAFFIFACFMAINSSNGYKKNMNELCTEFNITNASFLSPEEKVKLIEQKLNEMVKIDREHFNADLQKFKYDNNITEFKITNSALGMCAITDSKLFYQIAYKEQDTKNSEQIYNIIDKKIICKYYPENGIHINQETNTNLSPITYLIDENRHEYFNWRVVRGLYKYWGKIDSKNLPLDKIVCWNIEGDIYEREQLSNRLAGATVGTLMFGGIVGAAAGFALAGKKTVTKDTRKIVLYVDSDSGELIKETIAYGNGYEDDDFRKLEDLLNKWLPEKKYRHEMFKDDTITEYTAKNNTATTSEETKNALPMPSAADELKKFKELLDQDIITQEEFDAKKKQLLGL